MQIAIVFNPGSGIRSAAKALSAVVASLASHNHVLHVIDCHKQPDFERELRRMTPDLDRAIVIGGDGTLSSVTNAIMASGNPNVPVAFVPTGRGKDSARSLSAWNAAEMANGAFELASIVSIDLIRITLASDTTRFATNISSIGLGARAAAVANGLPRAFGSLSYILGAVRAMIPLKPFQLNVIIDGEKHRVENALLIAACNGKSFGGGIYLAPEAEPDDGLIDIVIVHNANLGDLALQLGKLKAGTLLEHPALSRWRGQTIEIQQPDHVPAEADGEALSYQPIRYEVVPAALKWVTS